jgi:Protein kinase domain
VVVGVGNVWVDDRGSGGECCGNLRVLGSLLHAVAAHVFGGSRPRSQSRCGGNVPMRKSPRVDSHAKSTLGTSHDESLFTLVLRHFQSWRCRNSNIDDFDRFSFVTAAQCHAAPHAQPQGSVFDGQVLGGLEHGTGRRRVRVGASGAVARHGRKGGAEKDFAALYQCQWFQDGNGRFIAHLRQWWTSQYIGFAGHVRRSQLLLSHSRFGNGGRNVRGTNRDKGNESHCVAHGQFIDANQLTGSATFVALLVIFWMPRSPTVARSPVVVFVQHLINYGAYSEADAARLMHEIASALAFLHGVGVVHADLKPENLLLSTKNRLDGTIKMIGKFGLLLDYRMRLSIFSKYSPVLLVATPKILAVPPCRMISWTTTKTTL